LSKIGEIIYGEGEAKLSNTDDEQESKEDLMKQAGPVVRVENHPNASTTGYIKETTDGEKSFPNYPLSRNDRDEAKSNKPVNCEGNTCECGEERNVDIEREEEDSETG
jgi:hypothetical protein